MIQPVDTKKRVEFSECYGAVTNSNETLYYWKTSAPTTGRVRYRKVGARRWRTVDGADRPTCDHRVVIGRDLEPGAYQFRAFGTTVEGKEVRSPILAGRLQTWSTMQPGVQRRPSRNLAECWDRADHARRHGGGIDVEGFLN